MMSGRRREMYTSKRRPMSQKRKPNSPRSPLSNRTHTHTHARAQIPDQQQQRAKAEHAATRWQGTALRGGRNGWRGARRAAPRAGRRERPRAGLPVRALRLPAPMQDVPRRARSVWRSETSVCCCCVCVLVGVGGPSLRPTGHSTAKLSPNTTPRGGLFVLALRLGLKSVSLTFSHKSF